MNTMNTMNLSTDVDGNSNSNLLQRVNEFHNDYYQNNSKNIFFKKKQKMECAKEISQKFQLHELIELFVYCVPNTAHIYLDYNIFKLFANETNYQMIIEKILKTIDECIFTYGHYNIHLNIESFTVSAGERYYSFIELYVKICLLYSEKHNFLYSDKLGVMYIYHPPSVLDILDKLFKKTIEKAVREKFIVVPKKDSKEAIEKLLGKL